MSGIEVENFDHRAPSAVNQHILKIYDKLEVTNKTEAINKLNTNRGQ